MANRDPGRIYVLAGTNGAGKSSVAGATLRRDGTNYFNPDEATRRIRALRPDVSEADANSSAWMHGKLRLERTIAERLTFAFETTLGGHTITALLEQALDEGLEVRIWFVGLDSPDRHIARVRARVSQGGHDIPDEKIRDRYNASRANLLRLLPRLTELRLFDNSAEADPATGHAPELLLVLHMTRGRITGMCPPIDVPGWAKPIVAAALRLQRR
ncbi:MAG: zeta toxin family protein [Vicinamibacterales bacterium]